MSVAAGEAVTLTAQAQDDDGEVVSLIWEQVSGPRTPLNPVDIDEGVYSFQAPNTGVDATAAMQFRLTAMDDDGAASSDTVMVTVSRVNQPPVVEVGNFRTVADQSTVTLSATAYDPDGEIVSYQWQQVDGMAVELSNATSNTASFTLPALEQQERLRFSLRVEDGEGASASDAITIVVASSDAPIVSLDFPPVKGVFNGSDIDVFGSVNLAESAELDRVVVDAGVAPVTATITEDGHWRASGVLLPEGVASATVEIAAYDNQGRVGYAESELRLGENLRTGSGELWIQSTAMVLSPAGDQAWVLAEGTQESDRKLLAIDLTTGHRTSNITNFSDPEQGQSASNYTDMVYDPNSNQFYLSAWREEEVEDSETGESYLQAIGSLHTVNATSGVRAQLELSGPEGFELLAPQGLFLRNSETLYVADEYGAQVLKVNPVSGETQVLADINTSLEALNAPVQVAWSESSQQLLVMQSSTGAVDMLGLDLTQSPAFSNLISEGEDISFGPVPLESSESLIVDDSSLRAFVLTTAADNVTEVDIASGERAILVEDVDPQGEQSKDMVYHPTSGVLYTVGGEDYYQQLLAVDPDSGDKVVVSTSRF